SPRNSTPQHTEPEPPKKYTGKVYALSYILDCRADEGLNKKDKKLKQDERERLLTKRCNGLLSGNTIRQEHNKIKHKEFTVFDLTETAGEGWKEIFIQLSTTPDKLKTYLKNERF